MPKRKLDPLPAAAFQILLSLAEGDLHGYAIMRQVEEQTAGKVRLGPGTLYSSIQALLEEGFDRRSRAASSDRRRLGHEPQDRRRLLPPDLRRKKVARTEAERLADILRVARAKKILQGGICLRRSIACLLRLYPARFRQQYGAEALQLFQDRLRDERGLLRKLRLWIDLLTDLASGLPQAYRNTYATPATTQAWQTATGLPAFRTLEEEPLRPGSVVMGGIFAIATLALFIFVMNHAAAYHPFSGSIGRLGAAAAGSESNPDVQAVAEKIEEQIRSANLLRKVLLRKARTASRQHRLRQTQLVPRSGILPRRLPKP